MNEKEVLPQELLSLRDALDRMARETPEPPESFRTGWREAIRREAAGSAPAEHTLPAAEEPQNGSPSAPVSPVVSRPKKLSWRRGLSIAAVFAFLLGGTLLSQDRASFLRGEESAVSGSLSARKTAVATASDIPVQETAAPAPVPTGLPLPASAQENAFVGGAFEADMEAAATEAVALAEESDMGAAGFAEETDMEEAAFAPEADMGAAGFAEEADTEEAAFAQDTYAEVTDLAEEKEMKAAGFAEEAGPAAEASEAAQDNAAQAVFAAETVPETVREEKAAADAAQSSPGPKRIAGFALLGLAFVLAALLLIFRKK